MVKILAELVAALSILNSSGATEKVEALVARATSSGASHSSEYKEANRTFARCNLEFQINERENEEKK